MFPENDVFSEKNRKKLLTIVKNSLDSAISGREYIPEEPECPELKTKSGVFVTLKTRGSLRGCLGCFSATRALYLIVAEYARHSLLDDPRFTDNRVKQHELIDMHIEISVLSPLKLCNNPENITLGKDGIYIKYGANSGCFLPQVALDTGWNVEEFWGHCARDKAGLAWGTWKDPGCECYTFTAEVLTENYVNIL